MQNKWYTWSLKERLTEEVLRGLDLFHVSGEGRGRQEWELGLENKIGEKGIGARGSNTYVVWLEVTWRKDFLGDLGE